MERVDRYRRESEGKSGRAFVGLVHRLDRNVSGAMVVAKTSKAASRLANAFRAHAGVEKTYLAWVAGEPESDRATLSSVLVRDVVRRVTRVVRPAPAPAGEGPAGDDEGGVATLAYEVEARGGGARASSCTCGRGRRTRSARSSRARGCRWSATRSTAGRRRRRRRGATGRRCTRGASWSPTPSAASR